MQVPKIPKLEKLWLEFVWLRLGSSRLSWQQSSKAEFTKRKWKWGFQQKGLQTRTTKLVEHWAENRNASRDIFLIRSRQTKFYCHHARLNQTKSLYISPTVSYECWFFSRAGSNLCLMKQICICRTGHWAENRNASRDIFLIRSRQTKFYCHSHHAICRVTQVLMSREQKRQQRHLPHPEQPNEVLLP